jgi:hypothetical protein
MFVEEMARMQTSTQELGFRVSGVQGLWDQDHGRGQPPWHQRGCFLRYYRSTIGFDQVYPQDSDR